MPAAPTEFSVAQDEAEGKRLETTLQRIADLEERAVAALNGGAEELAAEAQLPNMIWRIANVGSDAIDDAPHDLVTLAYVLNELAPHVRPLALARLWRLAADTLF